MGFPVHLSLSQGPTKPMTQVCCGLTTPWQQVTRLLARLSGKGKAGDI